MFKEIPLSDLVISNKNVRRSVDNTNEETNLETLAHDIKHNGLINPLSVRKADSGKYEVYAGDYVKFPNHPSYPYHIEGPTLFVISEKDDQISNTPGSTLSLL